jgi:hypothetical protein
MVMSQCGCSRFIAKSVVLVAVNATTYAKMISGINLNKAKETKANKHRAKPKPILYDELKKSVLTPAEVVEAIKTAHPTLAKYIYSGSANKLMLEESEIMTSVLCRLMKNNVPALPIHDSVLVPARCEEVTRQAMTGCYHERTGFHINLKIQSPPL